MERTILAEARTPGGCELRLVAYAPMVEQSAHAHDRDSISLVLAGGLVEVSESGRERAANLSVVAKSAGCEHADVFGSGGALTLQVELPGRRLRGARWDHVGPAGPSLLRLVAGLEGDLALSDALVERALASFDQRPKCVPPPPWLEAVRSTLEHDSDSIAVVARRAGCHPVYLARCFRESFGLSPRAWRARMRVRRAVGAIFAGEKSKDVALDAGFYDQPHMTRAVRAATGLTPRALRRLVVGRLPA